MVSRPHILAHPDPFEQAPIAREIWDLKYRLKAPDGAPVEASIADTWTRVAEAAAAAEKGGKRVRARWAREFHEALASFELLPAGRILAGAGTGRRVTLFNCFVMGPIADDLGSIFDNVKEAALTMQQGGGIGHDFSTLRPAGAAVVSTGSDASGPVSFMDVWDAMCRTIMSAGARRGAMMGTLRCDHPDIETFIAAKADERRLRNFNLSVLVTDAFITAVRDDRPWPLVFAGKVYKTVSAPALWQKLMRATYDYAEPGVIFIDRVNRLNNLAYCEEIRATNPCVTGETWVQTCAGPRQVRDLVGQQTNVVLDGHVHRSAPVGFFSTGRQPVVCVKTVEGFNLRLTAKHRLRCVTRRTRWTIDSDWCEAGKLRAGDQLLVNDHRMAAEWPGEMTEPEGYLLGMLVGDGSLKSDKAVLSVWWPAAVAGGDQSSLPLGVRSVMDAVIQAARTMPHRSDFQGWSQVANRNECRLSLGALRSMALRLGMQPGDKQITPAMERASSAFYRGFLRGFFDADGSVQGTHIKGISVRLTQSDLARLQAAQRMLLRLGIFSTIYSHRHEAGFSMLPDGRGGTAHYPTLPQHELIVSGDSLLQFQNVVGFAHFDKAERLRTALAGYRRAMNREHFVARVEAVVADGDEEVFDIQVPGSNAFDANGFVAHNCGEQPLPPYGACLLGSINLARLVDHPFTQGARLDSARLESRVRTAVRLLDDVIDVSRYPLVLQEQEAKAKRRIGLGVTGLADALIMTGQRYGTPEAAATAATWMATLECAAYQASAELAVEKGAFPRYDADKFLASANVARLPACVREEITRHGIRNGCLTSIAPTGTISLLAGNVSGGVEPVFDFVYERRLRQADGSHVTETVADYAYALFRDRFGPDAALPDTFVTAAQLTPRQHLEMQAAVQCHIDSSISKTINCPIDMTFADFESVYLQAFDLGLKGCTTFRPNAVTGAVLTAGTAAASAPIASVAPAEPKTPVPPASLPRPTGAGSIVYMAQPLERDAVLAGFTYKLRWPGSDHAIYVTINDIERDGRRRPFEVFINTKNLEHYAWTVALTRMISAVFRRGGDVTFVVEEMKAVFDPQGGHWIGGRYVPSLLAAIGEVIERHMIRIGFLQGDPGMALADDLREEPREAAVRLEAASVAAANRDRDAAMAAPTVGGAAAAAAAARARHCPRCNQPAMVREEACWVCKSCGFSRCG